MKFYALGRFGHMSKKFLIDALCVHEADAQLIKARHKIEDYQVVRVNAEDIDLTTFTANEWEKIL